MTGMRRNEVLGLKWSDLDFKKRRLHLNRGLVAVGYEVLPRVWWTKTARRVIELDATTINVLEGWHAYQAAEFVAVGIDRGDDWVFTDGDPVHPRAVYEAFRRIVHNAGIPTMRFHDLRHTHGSLLKLRHRGRRVAERSLRDPRFAVDLRGAPPVVEPGRPPPLELRASRLAPLRRLEVPTPQMRSRQPHRSSGAPASHRSTFGFAARRSTAFGRPPSENLQVRTLRRPSPPCRSGTASTLCVEEV
jgi:hypothetical protein